MTMTNHPAYKAMLEREAAAEARDHDFDVLVREYFDIQADLLLRKHRDYGPTNISRSPGGPINGLRVRMWDKLARINNLVDNNLEASNEPLRDSFLDLANYAVIALMVLDNEWPAE